MQTEPISTAQQLCFRTLCGLRREISHQPPRKAAVMSLAIAATRGVSRRRNQCARCLYAGACQNPDERIVRHFKSQMRAVH